MAHITDAQLEAIDAVLANAKGQDVPVPHQCHNIAGEITDQRLLDLGFTHYADMPAYEAKRPYERSLWVMRLSDFRAVPELHVLATLRYSVLLPWQRPYWQDKNWENKALENVLIFDQAKRGRVSSPQTSKYGVKAGTKEYRKKYYADPANRARLRAQTRESARRKRMKLREARQIISADPIAAQKLDELAKSLLGDTFEKLLAPKPVALDPSAYAPPPAQEEQASTYAPPAVKTYIGPPCPECGAELTSRTCPCGWDAMKALQQDGTEVKETDETQTDKNQNVAT